MNGKGILFSSIFLFWSSLSIFTGKKRKKEAPLEGFTTGSREGLEQGLGGMLFWKLPFIRPFLVLPSVSSHAVPSMADEDEISEGELEEEEKPVEKPGLDYEQLDEATGFKKVEWEIWKVWDVPPASPPPSVPNHPL